jgi:DNA-directed RNA polymerase alpha subunit
MNEPNLTADSISNDLNSTINDIKSTINDLNSIIKIPKIPNVEMISLCNSLRRIMISDIPTIAIDVVKILKNTSILPDETISHRVGLIPIKIFNKDTENQLDPDTKLYIELDTSGINDIGTSTGTSTKDIGTSTKDGTSIKTIFSNSLIIKNKSSDFEIPPDYIIAKIKRGQEIKLTAIATVNTGYAHAKWSPSCGVSFIENENEFVFNIESTSALPPRDIFIRSVSILKEKLEELKF